MRTCEKTNNIPLWKKRASWARKKRGKQGASWNKWAWYATVKELKRSFQVSRRNRCLDGEVFRVDRDGVDPALPT